MIKNPKNGWCSFSIGNFQGSPSYLTDVPIDLLQSFIDLRTKGSGSAFLDEEGTTFTFVLTPYSIFIIEEKEKATLHDLSDLNIDDIEKELIKDIESDLDGFSNFIVYEEKEEILKHRKDILKLIEILKKKDF